MGSDIEFERRISGAWIGGNDAPQSGFCQWPYCCQQSAVSFQLFQLRFGPLHQGIHAQFGGYRKTLVQQSQSFVWVRLPIGCL